MKVDRGDWLSGHVSISTASHTIYTRATYDDEYSEINQTIISGVDLIITTTGAGAFSIALEEGWNMISSPASSGYTAKSWCMDLGSKEIIRKNTDTGAYDEYVYELEQMGQKEDALGIKEWAKQEVFPEGYMESKINEELDRESQEGLDNFLRVTGWEIKDEKEFPSEIEAENWAKENGYSIGSMQRGAPRAMAQGDMYIAKWRNIGDEDYERIEALLLVSGEQGDRSAKIVFFDTVLE